MIHYLSGRTGAAVLYIAAQNRHLGVVDLPLEKGANREATESADAPMLYVAAYLQWTYGGSKAAIRKGCKYRGSNKHSAYRH